MKKLYVVCTIVTALVMSGFVPIPTVSAMRDDAEVAQVDIPADSSR